MGWFSHGLREPILRAAFLSTNSSSARLAATSLMRTLFALSSSLGQPMLLASTEKGNPFSALSSALNILGIIDGLGFLFLSPFMEELAFTCDHSLNLPPIYSSVKRKKNLPTLAREYNFPNIQEFLCFLKTCRRPRRRPRLKKI